MTKSLSPAAQAVKDAALSMYADCNIKRLAWPLDMPVVAAALRAAVVQTQHPGSKHYRGFDNWQCDAGALLAIATELEGTND
jgi:hypothetical protein